MTWLRTARGAAAADVGLALAVAALGVTGHLLALGNPMVEAAPAGPVILPLAVAAGAVLGWRRRHPFRTLAALVVIVLVAANVHEPGLYAAQLAAGCMLAAHALGRWSSRRVWVWVALGVLALVIGVGAGASSGSWASAAAFAAAIVALPGLLGAIGRVRAAYLAEVEQRLADAERERTERAEAAVGAERARIARELHDVVAHHVSLIGVQAGAARATLDRSPERARAALSSIEQSSREAVHEMHRLLHVLRPVGGEAPGSGAQLSPQPTLPDLPATAARWSQAGLEVSLQLTGPIDAVDPARSTCAYRIAEEALTNVSRHSSATAASVTVTVGDQVTVDVLDPGPARVTTSPGSGRGLVGMRERAAIFGGTVSAGQDGTGFRVTARLPRSTDG